jgi:hypothetical protein
MAGMLGTITGAVMRPFAYSVSPQQTETLSIQAAPALGAAELLSLHCKAPRLKTNGIMNKLSGMRAEI